jgi:hypothetical protein
VPDPDMSVGILDQDLLDDKRDGSTRPKIIRILPIRILSTYYRYIEERTTRKRDLNK